MVLSRRLGAAGMVSTSGFVLGLIGGVLDFASATSIVLNQTTQSGTMMTQGGTSSLDVALGLYLLGVLVIASSLFSAMLVGMRHPRLFSALMMVYGLVMGATGWTLLNEMVSTAAASLYMYGMLLVGALMFINGILMVRTRVEV